MKETLPIFHPMGHIIAAYLVAKGVVPEQLSLFEAGVMVGQHPSRRVVNVPTGGVL